MNRRELLRRATALVFATRLGRLEAAFASTRGTLDALVEFVVSDRQDSVGLGRIFADDNCDYTLEFLRTAGVDFLDAGVRMRRMQDLPDQHAGKRQVIGVLAGTCGLGGGIDHGNGFADDGKITHLHAIPFCSASIADLIASYIWL